MNIKYSIEKDELSVKRFFQIPVKRNKPSNKEGI